MTNRQARRDQARASRTQRSRPSSQRSPQTPRSGGGGGSWLTQPYTIGVAALVVVLAGVLVFLAVTGEDSGSDQVAAIEESLASFPFDMVEGNAVGDPDAPIELVAYEDFRCPFCLNFTASAEPTIIDEYVKEGLVRYEYRNFSILGQESVNAGRAVQCAQEQDKFWEMHHKLFIEAAERGGGTDAPSGTFSGDSLKGYASEIGLDTGAFNTCYDNNETLEDVNQQVGEARSFGFTGTPSFLLNGTPLTGGGPADGEGWREIFDAILEGTPTAEATGGQSTAQPGGTAATTPSAAATGTP